MKKHPQIYQIREFGDIITKRPDKMDYETYRELLREQNRRLKSRLKGFVVWKSKGYTTLGSGKDKPGRTIGESWGTLVGCVPSIEFVK